MTDEAVREKQYSSDWGGHSRLHQAIEGRIAKLETFRDEAIALWGEQLGEMRIIKWLVSIIVLASAPKLLELLRLVWH